MSNIYKAMLIDGLLAVGIYFWVARGVVGAGHVVIFFLWVITVMVWISVLAGNPEKIFSEARPKWWSYYNLASSIAVIGVLAWMEHPMLAAFCTCGFMLVEGARKRYEADKGGRE